MRLKKHIFLNHKKSSALVLSVSIHAVIIVLAFSFVAVKVYVKPEQIFEVADVKRPKMKLRKLQVPVRQDEKTHAPKLRQNIITKPRLQDVAIKMPEVVGVPGGAYGQGDGLGGLGFGMNFNFFGLSTSTALDPHVVFIIDYSQSMKGEKDKIMRREVVRVLRELPEGTQFGVILFAGPAWPAGDGQANSLNDWVWSGDPMTYRPKDWNELPEVEYQPVNPGRISSMVRVIESTPLVFGTVYDCPIYMALRMEPLPNTIFFMTDGACSNERGIVSLRKMVEQLKAAEKKVPVMHTVGFGIPNNRQLQEMARLMGGECKFLTAEEYIRKYGVDEDSSSGNRTASVLDASKIERVPAAEYPVEFSLK